MKNPLRYLRDFLRDRPAVAPLPYRAAPLQSVDAVQYLYAPSPRHDEYLAQYALSVWVSVAVDRLSEAACSVPLKVFDRADPLKEYTDHPLLNLLGAWGQPNDYQDVTEFYRDHFTKLELAGNSFWYWYSSTGSSTPDEVYILDPREVQVIPGASRTVAGYLYRHGGREIILSTDEVTQYRKPHPVSRYYGLSALESLRLMLQGDRAMERWNYDLFGEGVALPAGVWVLPENVSDDELHRFDDEINAKYAQRRKTGVVRAGAGSTVFVPAGLNQREIDFSQGRMLSRQAVYERLGLPLGLLSASSTEAHARVAERQLYNGIWLRLYQLASKLTIDALPFFAASSRRIARFEDVRQQYTDWQQMSMKLASIRPYMSRDEVRTKFLDLPATGEEYAPANPSTPDQQPTDRRRDRAVQPDGSARNDVQPADELRAGTDRSETGFILARLEVAPDEGRDF